MKNLLFRFITVVLVLIVYMSYSQCTPDPGCVDDSLPGQICPEVLPDGTIGVSYQQVMTIIPPSEVTIGTSTQPIFKIVLTGIQNLPPGINYQSNTPTNEFYPDTTYCVLIDGVPTDTGIYYLKIITDVYIDYLGFPVYVGEITDSTSYFILVNPVDTNSVPLLYSESFRMLPVPNPCSGDDRIGFYSPEKQNVTLEILNFTGQKVYKEYLKAFPGRNFFSFSCNNIKEGLYIYSVRYTNVLFNSRLIITNP